MEDGNLHNKKIELEASLVLVVLLLGVSAYLYISLKATEKELITQNVAYDTNIALLKQQMAEIQGENDSITATLTDQQKANLELEREERKQQRKLDNLTKLATLDPELLQKYSKVFFLSENYVPKSLVSVDPKYVGTAGRDIKVLADIKDSLEEMLADAESNGVTILIASGYRSFDEQKNLKDAYTVVYGAGTANSFSAEQGYSEHQLGTTLDFTTPSLKGALPGFDGTTAYQWLTDNAHKYGFTLSYPKGNAFYKYEPWHWRFVGEELATYLYNQDKYFYELDQRSIDGFLLDIFN